MLRWPYRGSKRYDLPRALATPFTQGRSVVKPRVFVNKISSVSCDYYSNWNQGLERITIIKQIKKSYWSKGRGKGTSTYRGSRGWAARKTDTNIQDTMDRFAALKAAALEMGEERRRRQEAQNVGPTDDPANLIADPAKDDDPQAEGTAYLDRVEAGLSPWWNDRF